MKITVLVFISLILSGCWWFPDSDGNYYIEVVNETDMKIEVLYNSNIQYGDFTEEDSIVTEIKLGESKWIHVNDEGSDTEIRVKYNSKSAYFDIDPDFWGRDHIYVHISDFNNPG